MDTPSCIPLHVRSRRPLQIVGNQLLPHGLDAAADILDFHIIFCTVAAESRQLKENQGRNPFVYMGSRLLRKHYHASALRPACVE